MAASEAELQLHDSPPMKPRAILPEGQPRCPSTRAVHCERAERCARAMAPHELGRGVVDFSRGYRPCLSFIALTVPEAKPERRQAHETPEGLR